MLPRLKYYNPSVPMLVSRPEQTGGKAEMAIYMKKSKSATSESPSSPEHAPYRPLEVGEGHISPDVRSQPPSASFDEDVVTIRMRGCTEGEIWDKFVEATKAKLVEPGLGELSAMQELQESKEMRGDRVEEKLNKEWLLQFKREQKIVRELEAREMMAAGRVQGSNASSQPTLSA